MAAHSPAADRIGGTAAAVAQSRGIKVSPVPDASGDRAAADDVDDTGPQAQERQVAAQVLGFPLLVQSAHGIWFVAVARSVPSARWLPGSPGGIRVSPA